LGGRRKDFNYAWKGGGGGWHYLEFISPVNTTMKGGPMLSPSRIDIVGHRLVGGRKGYLRTIGRGKVAMKRKGGS